MARRKAAFEVRVTAAELAKEREHPVHRANGDELRFRHDEKTGADHPGKPSYLASYTKGLAHDETTGLVAEPDDFQRFVIGIENSDPRDFEKTPLGPGRELGGAEREVRDPPPDRPTWASEKAQTADEGKPAKLRAWESAGAGHAFDLEGPDAQAVTMPPAPCLGTPEMTGEMGEVYVQSLLRDVPFAAMAHGTAGATAAQRQAVNDRLDLLNDLPWFDGSAISGLSDHEAGRRRTNLQRATAFRGLARGDDVGPYISQFMLAGNRGINKADTAWKPEEGLVSYGALFVNQRVRFAEPGDDHMTTWEAWLDVQNGADLRGLEGYQAKPKARRRFITTPRDLATFVHYDALYEAYLNACLYLLATCAPFDPGIPFQRGDDVDHQQAFAHFGGPHILSLVTEVATRALKAVRYQKFNIHRRYRPEALAGRIEKVNELKSIAPELVATAEALKEAGILNAVKTRTTALNGRGKGTHLLPMAFCEGSPMHPSYGAGHGTVAGACVTVLKAFFDHGQPLDVTGDGPGRAFVPNRAGIKLVEVDVKNSDGQDDILTVEGELNKLAANISIGRNWAGVHFFTDYIESVRLGEQIALGVLQEQKLTFRETFHMTVPLFDGTNVRI